MAAKVKGLVDRDLGWSGFVKRSRSMRDSTIKVGVLADSTKGAAAHEGGDLTVAELAAVLHYGTDDGHIPPRPFLTMAFDENRAALAEMGGKLAAAVLVDKIPVEQALNIMGAKLATEAKKVITVGNKLAPNAPSTVARKGSSRPLVDTGRLVNSITWMREKK